MGRRNEVFKSPHLQVSASGSALVEFLFAIGLLAASVCPCFGVESLQIGTAKQLFIGNRFVNNAVGVQLAVNKPRLDQEKLIVPQYAWEDQEVGGYTSVIQEGNRIKLWYEARSAQGDESLAYAYSDDGGRTFTKPNLGIVDFHGSTANNLVLTGGEGFQVFALGADANGQQRYGALRYIDKVGSTYPIKTNRAYVSPDGLNWTGIGTAPFLFEQKETDGIQTLDSQNATFWDTRLQKYVCYPRQFSATMGRAVGRMEGATFTQAAFPQAAAPTVLNRDAQDAGKQFYTSAAVQYAYAAEAYLAFPAMLNGESGPVDIQFAASRDGITWDRPDRTPIIHNGFDQQGNTVAYANGSLYAGYGLTRQGSELSLYYTTYGSKHVWPMPANSGIVSRAIWRLDGFTSVDAGGTAGQFDTGLVKFDGDCLQLNYQTLSDGWLKVEILDEQGTPIPGFTMGDSDSLTGDSVDVAVTFGGSADLSRLQGQNVAFRFQMQDAKLYAFQVAVPEPAIWVLLLTGIIGWAWRGSVRWFRSYRGVR